MCIDHNNYFIFNRTVFESTKLFIDCPLSLVFSQLIKEITMNLYVTALQHP